MSPKDKFTQLVEDLNTGKLSVRHLEIAYKTHVRASKFVPETAKSILCGEGEASAGLISKHFSLISHTIGGFELAILREKDFKKGGDE